MRDDDDVAQHGGHFPVNKLHQAYRPWFAAFVFDIKHGRSQDFSKRWSHCVKVRVLSMFLVTCCELFV